MVDLFERKGDGCRCECVESKFCLIYFVVLRWDESEVIGRLMELIMDEKVVIVCIWVFVMKLVCMFENIVEVYSLF